MEASGPSYSVTSLCRALIEAGQPTKLAVLEPLPEKPGFHFAMAFPYGLGPRRLGVSPKMKRWLRDEARSGNSRILHNHSLWMMPNIYPAAAVRGTDCKLVISPRGTLSAWALAHSAWIKKPMWHALQGKVMRKATAFHATSQGEYRELRDQGLRQPVAILPNGVDVGKAGIEPVKKRKEVLFLSRIHPKKGIANLLQAWRDVAERHPDWQLIIAGPDELDHTREMKTLANKLGVERCAFPGPLYGADKQRAYRQSSLYVLPTYSENFGMTVAEALAAGTPAIVTKGAPWQGLEPEGAGWWIDIGAEPLAAALDEAFSLPVEALEQKGAAARDWMIRDFSWAKIGEDMAEFYDWLVNGGDRPPFVRID